MKATSEGVLVPWDELPDVLTCVNDAMRYNAEWRDKWKRKRGENRDEFRVELWQKGYDHVHAIGKALVDAYKEAHPEAEVRYAKAAE